MAKKEHPPVLLLRMSYGGGMVYEMDSIHGMDAHAEMVRTLARSFRKALETVTDGRLGADADYELTIRLDRRK